jgi:hypothetical protein
MKIQKKFQGTIPENKILDTYSASNTDVYSCNYINQKINNDLIRVVLSSNKTMSNTAYTIIPFNTIAERINANNSFEFNSSTGEITILNENVKKIRVYASVLDNAWGSDNMYLRVKKNGSVIKASHLKGQSNIALDTELSATKNDVIAVDFYCATTKTLANGWEYTQMVVSVA